MTTVAEFFEMSGYAFNVWTAYGLGAAALLLNVWWARRNLARSRAEARRRFASRPVRTP
jgi:heme exporter protein CcmD